MRLTEERRALIARYLIDASAPTVGAAREAPMRREAVEEAVRQAVIAHERTRREAEERVAQRVALAAVAEKARRKAADERMRREALEEAAWRAAESEARAERQAEMEHARYAAEAEEARERRAAADRAARLALAAEEEARRQAAAERTRRLAAEDAARAAAEGAQPPQRIDHDPTTRLTAAVIRLQTSADATATRVERLTWALVGLGLVVAVLAVVLALKS